MNFYDQVLREIVAAIGAALFVIVAFCIVGQMDYEDAIEQERHYCDMVREGHWPAYKPEIDCKRVDQQHMVRGIKL